MMLRCFSLKFRSTGTGLAWWYRFPPAACDSEGAFCSLMCAACRSVRYNANRILWNCGSPVSSSHFTIHLSAMQARETPEVWLTHGGVGKGPARGVAQPAQASPWPLSPGLQLCWGRQTVGEGSRGSMGFCRGWVRWPCAGGEGRVCVLGGVRSGPGSSWLRGYDSASQP